MTNSELYGILYIENKNKKGRALMAAGTTRDDRDLYIETAVNDYITHHDIAITELIDNHGDIARNIRVELISDINETINLANQIKAKNDKIPALKTLPGYAVAMLLIATGDVKRLTLGSSGYRLVAKRYYKNEDGEWVWAGTYEIINENEDDNAVMRALSLLIPDASRHDERSMLRYLVCHSDAVTLHTDNKLVYFRNGVFDYRTKTLTEYNSADYDDTYGKIITLAKLPVFHPLGSGSVLTADANGNIAEPIIHNDKDGTDWRPSSCFSDPFSNDATGDACRRIVWEATQFLIRHMNGSPHLYHFWIDAGGKGHNGKSTLWEAMQRLIKKDLGADDADLRTSGDTVINCAIENLEKDYVLAQNITTAFAIVGEESNAATSYIENCAMVKMLSRAQEYTFRQIRQEPFSFKFEGMLVQQCNKPPLFAEKTDSMFTHSVNIPFSQTFTDDRAYIKDDYILREEVAEWIAYHVTVEMDALEAYDADALKTLEPFKREMLADGMSTMQALDEIIPGLKMNFMPSELLYDLYIRWCDLNGVTGRAVVSAKVFRDDLEQYGINNNYDVEYTKKFARTSTKDLDNKHPALINFGYSNKNSYSAFVAMRLNTGNEGRLNRDQMLDENGKKGRLWTKGGLKRNTKWQDIKEEAIIVEIDEDAEA